MEHGCAYDVIGCLSWLFILIAGLAALGVVFFMIAAAVAMAEGDNVNSPLSALLGCLIVAVVFGFLAQRLGREADKLRNIP